jgi:ABC-type transport system substrate-binding protein
MHLSPSPPSIFFVPPQSKVTTQRIIGPNDVSTTPLNAGEAVQRVTFVSNPLYWAGAPAAQRVVLPANLSSSVVRSGLESGSINLAYGASVLSPSDFVALRDGPAAAAGTLRALVSQPLQTRLLLLNTAPGHATSSLAVRQAVNFALDRTDLASTLSDLELPAARVFSTDNAYCAVDIGTLPPIIAQPVQAANALTTDGWLFANVGDIYRSKGGVQLTLEVLVIATDASAATIAPVIAAQLRVVGINASVIGVSKVEFNSRGFAGNFDTMITETLGDPYDPASYTASWRVPRSFEYPAQQGLDGSGPSGVNKAALDADITAVFVMLDETARAATWQRILNVVNTEALFAPLTYMATRAVVRAEVAGFTFGQQQYDLPLAGVTLQSPGGSDASDSGLTSGAIAGIAVGSVVGVALLGTVVFLAVKRFA